MPLGSLVLDLHVGVEGSLGDHLEVQLIGAVVRVGVSLDSLAELLEDPLDLGRLLQVLPVGSLEEPDVLRLVGLCLEHSGEVEGVDDLVDLGLFGIWLQDRLLRLVHLLVLRLLLDDRWRLAYCHGLLFPEVHVRREDGDVLHLFLTLRLLELRKILVLGLALHLEGLGLDHLLCGGVGVSLVELIIALHRDLRGSHSPRHGRDDSLLGQVVHKIIALISFEAVRVLLGVHLVLVVLRLLREQVIEDRLQVARRALLHASLHGARLQEEHEGVSDVLPLPLG